MSETEAALAFYRAEIDEIDAQLLDLLNKRAKAALSIGKMKKAQGLPIYVPEREEQVLASLTRRNPGPMHGEMITAVYREIITQMKILEESISNTE